MPTLTQLERKMLGLKLDNLRGDLFGGLTAGVVALDRGRRLEAAG